MLIERTRRPEPGCGAYERLIQVKYGISRGFTLAEILIALTIIGVISAVTVPVLMQNTNKQEYVTALKKTYSTLSQVTNQITAEEGSPKGDDGWAKSDDTVYDMYKKYLNNAKECGKKECAYQKKVKFLNNNTDADLWKENGYQRLITADGVRLYFVGASSGCKLSSWSISNGCGAIVADINGAKQPNQWGRDTFIFGFNENGLFPGGCPDAYNDCQKISTGRGCTCKVLREGAMNY